MKRDIDTLLAQLNNDDNTTRLTAIRELQQIDDARVLSALKLLVKDDSIAIVRRAILAIGTLGGCAELPFLMLLTEHESVWIRKASIQAIGTTGCQDAVPHLVNLLGDDTLDALVREALVALKVDPDFF